jgi:hypothetical protein
VGAPSAESCGNRASHPPPCVGNLGCAFPERCLLVRRVPAGPCPHLRREPPGPPPVAFGLPEHALRARHAVPGQVPEQEGERDGLSGGGRGRPEASA